MILYASGGDQVIIRYASIRRRAPLLRKKIKRGGSTVIWKWKWGYKSAPENDFPIEIGNSESAKS